MRKGKTQLCLGTAKFGDPTYGHGSARPADHPSRLLKTAEDYHIGWLDTSPRYGDSESLIGNNMPINAAFNISSKIDGLDPSGPNLEATMLSSLKSSLYNLKKDSIELVYLHQHSLDILRNDAVKDGLRKIKECGLSQSVGASVYTTSEIDGVIEDNIFEWIQISGNILDISQILYIRKHAPHLKIAVRSIYLQGLILNPEKIGTHIPFNKNLRDLINELALMVDDVGISLEQASISFIVNELKPEKVIFGTNVSSHIEQFYTATNVELKKTLVEALKELSSFPKEWTNPQKWT